MTSQTGDHAGNADPSAEGNQRFRPGAGEHTRPLVLAVWLGLVAWLGEYGILTYRRFVLNHPKVWYLESLWLAALTYPLVFGLIGIGLSRVRRSGGGSRLGRAGLAILIALVAMSVLLSLDGLHRLAVLVLSAGIGLQVAVVMTARPAGTRRLVRATLPVLAAVMGVSVITAVVWDPIRERMAYARMPAAEANAPNILLLILDTVRSRDLGLYGYERPTTPALEAFARRGTTFDFTVSTAPWTLPSHFSMFTGLQTHELSAPLEEDPKHAVPASQPFLAEVLADQGYASAGFIANMSYLTDEYGLDRGFARWYDHRPTFGQWAISTAIGRTIANNGRWRRLLDYHEFPIRKPAGRLNAHLLDWLSQKRDRPFFAFVNYFDAHVPYLPPPEFEQRFVREPRSEPYFYLPHATRWITNRGLSKKEYRAERDLYDGAIAYLDHEIGRLLDELGRRGLLDNTLVVITSDHGEAFGEHGRLGHSGFPYLELLRVPLLISFPGRVPAGLRIETPVTIADLPATILDLLDIGNKGIPGRSLGAAWTSTGGGGPATPLLARDKPGDDRAESILLDGFHLIREPGRIELYDIEADIEEQRNRAGDPAFAGIQARLEAALDSATAATPSPDR